MKLPSFITLVASLSMGYAPLVASEGELCKPLITPEEWNGQGPALGEPKVGVQVVKKGEVPAINSSGYNMAVVENFDKIYVIDQKEGIIYSFENGAYKTVFEADVLEKIIDLNVNYPGFTWPGGIQRVSAMFPGKTKDSAVVVVLASTLPEGLTTDKKAGNTKAKNLEVPEDACAGTEAGPFEEYCVPGNDCYKTCQYHTFEPQDGRPVYKVFFHVEIKKSDGKLVNPTPFFAFERARDTFGHDSGAGGYTVPDGRILVPVGDCIAFGGDGGFAAQDDGEHCGKILLINPDDGSYDIAAKGVRNCQQISDYQNGLLQFMDIGGITAEEVNVVRLEDLLDTEKIENFGWGVRKGEDFAREGTFKVGPGQARLGTVSPPCIGRQTEKEAKGFFQPWMQYGRGEDLPLFGITSSITSDESFNRIKLATTEFNTGLLICAKEEYDESKTQGAFIVPLFDEEMNPLDTGFNSLTESGTRCEPRLFKYPDGSAGVFLERTGELYTLAEIEIE